MEGGREGQRQGWREGWRETRIYFYSLDAYAVVVHVLFTNSIHCNETTVTNKSRVSNNLLAASRPCLCCGSFAAVSVVSHLTRPRNLVPSQPASLFPPPPLLGHFTKEAVQHAVIGYS